MFEDLRTEIDLFLIRTKMALEESKTNAKEFFKDERGDTNFISILIILGIVVILAGIFIGFKDQIVGLVRGEVGTFSGKFSGQDKG